MTEKGHDTITVYELASTICINDDPRHVIARNSWEAERNYAFQITATKPVVDRVHARSQDLDQQLAWQATWKRLIGDASQNDSLRDRGFRQSELVNISMPQDMS